jgi:hypothetical protein
MYSSELIKGTLKTIILKLLVENKRMYGYEITAKVKELTADKIQLTEGALYPTLHALEADGLLAICLQHENDHLDGIVFIERLSAFKNNFFKKKLTKNKKTSKAL